MKYVLIHNMLSIISKHYVYLTEKEQGNFIQTTNNVDEARKFDSIEELDKFAKERKIKKKDFSVIELDKED